MQFEDANHGGVPVVRLKGRLDSRAAELCAARLLLLVADGRRALVLDMGEVDYVGGAGLRVLLMLSARARGCGSALRICSPPPLLVKALEVSGLADRLALDAEIASA